MYCKINVFGQHWVSFIWYAFSRMAFMLEAWPEPKSIKTFGSEGERESVIEEQRGWLREKLSDTQNPVNRYPPPLLIHIFHHFSPLALIFDSAFAFRNENFRKKNQNQLNERTKMNKIEWEWDQEKREREQKSCQWHWIQATHILRMYQ